MAMMSAVLLGLGLVILAAQSAHAESCLYYNSLLDQGTLYCSSGCCGDYYNRYCCIWGAGSIAGTVVGGIVFVAIIVIIVFCCRRRRMAGRIVYTQQPGISVINTSQTTTMPQYVSPPPYPGQPQYPPPQQY